MNYLVALIIAAVMGLFILLGYQYSACDGSFVKGLFWYVCIEAKE